MSQLTQIRSLKVATLISITAAATTLVIHGCGGSAGITSAEAADVADPIEGVWESTITIKDCSNAAVVRTFKGLSLFHRGGSLNSDNSAPTITRGAAFGNWRRGVAAGSYTTNFVFFRFNPDGSYAGSQKVMRTFALGADNNSLSGTLEGSLLDPAGVVIAPVCGSEVAARVY